MLSEYREWFVAIFGVIVGIYGTRLTGKQTEQSLISKLFEEIERIDLDNKEMRAENKAMREENKETTLRLDKIERENHSLKEQVVVLTKERDELMSVVILRDDTIIELKDVIENALET